MLKMSAHAWYEGTGKPEHPYEGTTIPKYTGLEKKDDGYAYLKTDEKYSWIKAPLYNGEKMEVGPLARMVIGYAKGDERIKRYVGNFLKRQDSLLRCYSQLLEERQVEL